jgi:hypothetical protein
MVADNSIQRNDNIISRLKAVRDDGLKPLITFLETLTRPFIMTFNHDSSVTVTYNEENNKVKNQYDFSQNIFSKVLDVSNFPISIVCTNKGYVLQEPIWHMQKEDTELSKALIRQQQLDLQTKNCEQRWSEIVITLSTLSWDPAAKKTKSTSKDTINFQQKFLY